MDQDIYYMKAAIEQAKIAQSYDEVPIGCVIVRNGKIISTGYNLKEKTQLSTAHAEMIAIEHACKVLGTWRLDDCDLYVTLEPCPMCTGAIIQSRIHRVIFGANDPKGGCIGSCVNLFEIKGFNHYPTYTSHVLQEECSQLLKKFFKKKRMKKKLSQS